MQQPIPITQENNPSGCVEDDLARAALRDPAAFQRLYDLWMVRVYRYLYAQTGSAADAEDLTSAVFLAAYQALPRYRPQGQFGAWLFTIARNQVHSQGRKRCREVDLEMAGKLSDGADVQVEADRHDDILRLRRMLQSLPHDEQELIRLRYTAGLSFAEMAGVLNRKVDAVKKALYRLQARLQRQLEVQND
jgi:RNA polymerase sigma-70 factor, ECF subfamily